MDVVKNIDKNIESVLGQYVKKPTLIRGIVHLVLMLYAARIAPTLPAPVLKLFENQYFKLFVFSLILWTAQFSPSTSLLISIAFMITVNYSHQRPLWEFLENVEENQKVEEVLKVDGAPGPELAPVPEQMVEPVAVSVPEVVVEKGDIPAPAPAPAPTPAEPKGLIQEPARCYPMRNYDMNKVSPQSSDNQFEEWKKA